MGFGNFLRNATISYGKQVQWQNNEDARQLEMAQRQQQLDINAAELAQKQQLAEARQRVGQFIAASQSADAGTVTDPTKQADLWSKASTQFAAAGDFASASQAGNLAANFTNQARTATLDLAKKKQEAQETLSSAALDFQANPSMDSANAVAKAAIAAGVDPTSIPLPTSATFDAWVQTQTQASMSGKDRIGALEKQREFEIKQEEARKRHEDWMQEQAENRKLRAAIQAGVAEDRRARLANSDANVGFQRSEKLNTSLQAAAKPLLEDRQRISDVKGLLAVNSPEADQQIRQALTSLSGHFKGHATNAFYKDNKNFGDVVQKLSGWASQTFTGRYSEDARRGIYNMLEGMERNVLDPSLQRLEKTQQEKGMRYGLDPENILIQGDFNRSPAAPAPVPAAPAAPAAHAPAAHAPAPVRPSQQPEFRRTKDGRLLRKNPDGSITEVH